MKMTQFKNRLKFLNNTTKMKGQMEESNLFKSKCEITIFFYQKCNCHLCANEKKIMAILHFSYQKFTASHGENRKHTEFVSNL